MRDKVQIEALADKAAATEGKTTQFFNMTYEDGVREALEWVLDDSISEEEWPLGLSE